MVRLAFVVAAVVALANTALAKEITAIAEQPAVAKKLPAVCKTKCDASLSSCRRGCNEEKTPKMEFFTVCQTECLRTHGYCSAGC